MSDGGQTRTLPPELGDLVARWRALEAQCVDNAAKAAEEAAHYIQNGLDASAAQAFRRHTRWIGEAHRANLARRAIEEGFRSSETSHGAAPRDA